MHLHFAHLLYTMTYSVGLCRTIAGINASWLPACQPHMISAPCTCWDSIPTQYKTLQLQSGLQIPGSVSLPARRSPSVAWQPLHARTPAVRDFLLQGGVQGQQVLDAPPVLHLLQLEIIVGRLELQQALPFLKQVGVGVAQRLQGESLLWAKMGRPAIRLVCTSLRGCGA